MGVKVLSSALTWRENDSHKERGKKTNLAVTRNFLESPNYACKAIVNHRLDDTLITYVSDNLMVIYTKTTNLL